MTLKLTDPDLARLRLNCMRVAVSMTPQKLGMGTVGYYVDMPDAERVAESLYHFALNPPGHAPQEDA